MQVLVLKKYMAECFSSLRIHDRWVNPRPPRPGETTSRRRRSLSRITAGNLRNLDLGDKIDGDVFYLDCSLKVVGGHFGSIAQQKSYFKVCVQRSMVCALHIIARVFE